MSSTTGIEWTDATWNTVTGCTKVSPGCDSCYAETFAERFRGVPGHHFENGFDVTLRPERILLPLKWRKPRRIFVNSMSDLFHDQVPDEHIAEVFAVMARTPQHTYQILTKRHGRMRSLLSNPTFGHLVAEQGRAGLIRCSEDWMAVGAMLLGKPLPNVWLGVSVEDQKRAELRIPVLLETPAAVRFLSCEPLLGPVDLTRIAAGSKQQPDMVYDALGQRYGVPGRWQAATSARVDWVIVGGESGRAARPMSPDWARSLRDQCADAGVPFLFKQWGEYAPTGYMAIGRTEPGRVHVGDPLDELGHRWEMRRLGKHRAGRELDGRTWDQYPA
ncbi:DUF5131 family protein [Streptomyces aidingensis]|uniref:Protein gp37 n=1 Tax=Streptomyces aidingensis TaxID=910347 RepID=A0A1I1PTM1_9ACTN|nr:phage Gp37/Gp68 family protein [Streptomyces aidingensis]SFD13216.1 protein gp37 [Streptomyces aidingensis]